MVAAIGNGVADDRANTWNGHQVPATLGAIGQHFDLFGDMLDALIEMPPIATEVLNDPDHTRRQHVDAFGQDLWKLLTKEAKPLTDRNAALQQKAADLIDHCGTLTD